MLRTKGCAFAIGMLSFAAAVDGADAGPSTSIGDWTVSCSNGVDCAIAIETEDASDITVLSLSRSAEAEAPLVVGIGLAQERESALTSDVVFEIQNGETLRFPASDFAFGPESGTLDSSAPQVLDGLLPAMADAMSVKVSLAIGDAQASRTFALNGLADALSFVDEAQRRDGTVTALQAKGDRPPIDPAVLPRDITTVDDVPADVRAVWRADPACRGGDHGDIGDLGYEAIGFSTAVQGGRLYGLMCEKPGAFNALYGLYRTDGEGVHPMPLPQMTDKGPIASSVGYNIDWSDKTRSLTALGRYRGMGDCGLYDRWVLDEAVEGETDIADNRFVLIESRFKEACDGEEAGGPEAWPRRWPRP